MLTLGTASNRRCAVATSSVMTCNLGWQDMVACHPRDHCFTIGSSLGESWVFRMASQASHSHAAHVGATIPNHAALLCRVFAPVSEVRQCGRLLTHQTGFSTTTDVAKRVPIHASRYTQVH